MINQCVAHVGDYESQKMHFLFFFLSQIYDLRNNTVCPKLASFFFLLLLFSGHVCDELTHHIEKVHIILPTGICWFDIKCTAVQTENLALILKDTCYIPCEHMNI